MLGLGCSFCVFCLSVVRFQVCFLFFVNLIFFRYSRTAVAITRLVMPAMTYVVVGNGASFGVSKRMVAE